MSDQKQVMEALRNWVWLRKERERKGVIWAHS